MPKRKQVRAADLEPAFPTAVDGRLVNPCLYVGEANHRLYWLAGTDPSQWWLCCRCRGRDPQGETTQDIGELLPNLNL